MPPIPLTTVTTEAVDIAARAERLGLIGVLALVSITLGYVLWRVHQKAMADKDETIQRLLAERNEAQKRERALHAYIDDTIVPLVTEASRGVSRTMRRVLDDDEG